MTEPIIMYIFVNSDLKMTKGKICSQCCHLVMVVTEEIIRQGYEVYPPQESYMTYIKWRTNCTKIILKATTEQLKKLMLMEEARHILDDDQIEPNSLVVVGFFPSSKMAEIAKDYKLL